MAKFPPIFFVVTTLILSALSAPSYGDSIKIGIIDLQKVAEKSERGKAILKNFEAELERKKGKLDFEDSKIKILEKEIFENLTKWDDEARGKKQEELNQKIKEYQREKEEFEEEINKKILELNQNMAGEILEVLSETAKKENYTIIFKKRNLLFFSPSLDITDKIIKKYDDAIK